MNCVVGDECRDNQITVGGLFFQREIFAHYYVQLTKSHIIKFAAPLWATPAQSTTIYLHVSKDKAECIVMGYHQGGIIPSGTKSCLQANYCNGWCFHLTRAVVVEETFKWPSGLVIGFINQLVTIFIQQEQQGEVHQWSREKEGVLCFTWKVYAVHDGWIADVTANDEEEPTTSFSRHNGREVVVVWARLVHSVAGSSCALPSSSKDSHLSFHSVDCAGQ